MELKKSKKRNFPAKNVAKILSSFAKWENGKRERVMNEQKEKAL
jgi:hypothetical protein